ncbi:MAG TPA: transporter substrate-binding domain-containing protein, partial [Chitinophagaceae bacterium]|nr:transporter substrate-binding domain-containing protein [Chitinophagaceae bacterium]
EDLKGKNIGVRIATEAEKYVRKYLSINNIVLSDTNDELYQKVNDGAIDLLIDDTPIAGAFVQKISKLKVCMFLPNSQSHYAIALKKGNIDLKKQINKVLSVLKQNGRYNAIYNRWFHEIEL